jgi:hypothetical protein
LIGNITLLISFAKLSISRKMPISISWPILQNFRSLEIGSLDHSPILTETLSNPIKNKKKKKQYIVTVSTKSQFFVPSYCILGDIKGNGQNYENQNVENQKELRK